MKVFVTGAGGFVGQEIVKQLRSSGHEVRALVHRPGRFDSKDNQSEIVSGDTTDYQSIRNYLEGCNAVIHLVGIIREQKSKGVSFERLHPLSTRNVLQAAADLGVKRYLHMSANGTAEEASSRYHQTKWAAEQLVRQSDLEWTIFRPSLIYGPGDLFINMLARMIKLAPIVPVMGDGNYPLQPVQVEDVARGFTAALENRETIHQTYSCCGPRVYSYNELLDLIGRALGRSRVPKLHQPLGLMRPLVSLFESLPFFPITRDQLLMLTAGNICEDNSWKTVFDLDLKNAEDEIRAQLTR